MGTFRIFPRITDLELSRFWAKVSLPDSDECMRWGAVKTGDGYGHFRLSGQMYPAHRIALTLATGETPVGLEVAHSCRNRDCVAALHLSWATRRQNHADKVRDGTHNRGERHVMVKLTEEQALEIRRLSATTGTVELALRFGIDRTTVRRIVRGILWAHLDEVI
jgi:hypothetical protein